MSSPSSRLHVVDALRGFAIVSIMLLHNLEHFDFYFTPENLPTWMPALDKVIWDTLFFLFSGKSYAIFALLFGLTFYIQSDNQQRQGKDFRARFAWRLILLLGFGIVNSAFYQGDILTTYALIGFALIPVVHLSSRAILIIASVLMFQPYEWYNVVNGLQNLQINMADPVSWSYFGKMGEYITGNSVVDTLVGNLTNGRTAVMHWTWESGRVFQTASLFMFGLLAGRRSLFASTSENREFWSKILVGSVLLFIPLFYLRSGIESGWIPYASLRNPLITIISSWSNLAFMLVLVSGFYLLFHTTIFKSTLNILAPFGRMSLSNYIIQSIIGSFIYYGFGLALYKYTSSTYCLFIGIALAVLQGLFSWWWMKNHKQGPLETLWHRATWVGSQK